MTATNKPPESWPPRLAVRDFSKYGEESFQCIGSLVKEKGDYISLIEHDFIVSQCQDNILETARECKEIHEAALKSAAEKIEKLRATLENISTIFIRSSKPGDWPFNKMHNIQKIAREALAETSANADDKGHFP